MRRKLLAILALVGIAASLAIPSPSPALAAANSLVMILGVNPGLTTQFLIQLADNRLVV